MAECFIILFSEEAPHTIQLVLNLDAMLLLYFFLEICLCSVEKSISFERMQ